MGVNMGLCEMGSFINLVKSGRFNEARKGDCEVEAIATCENTMFWLGRGFICDIPCYVFDWLPEWVALLCPPGVVGGVVCGVVLGGRPGFPTKDSPIKDEPIMVATFHLWCLIGERLRTPPGNEGRSKICLDQRGPIGSVLALTRSGFGNIWEDIDNNQRKILITYIKQSENKINFPFKLILCDQSIKNMVFVCLCMILKS